MNSIGSRNSEYLPAAILLLLAAIGFVGPSANAESCIREQAGQSVVCTANDVRITFADNVRDIFGAPLLECVRGESFSFIADFHIRTTATARYDIGLYFGTDGDPNGDGASSGVCSAQIIKDRHVDPAYPHAVVLGSAVAANLDGDACRDINSAQGWRNIAGKIVTLRIDNALCHDSDADEKLNLPNCATWSNGAAAACNSPNNTAPSSSSNCSCDLSFNLPILVAPGSNQVTENDHQISTAAPRIRPVLLSESITAPQGDAD